MSQAGGTLRRPETEGAKTIIVCWHFRFFTLRPNRTRSRWVTACPYRQISHQSTNLTSALLATTTGKIFFFFLLSFHLSVSLTVKPRNTDSFNKHSKQNGRPCGKVVQQSKHVYSTLQWQRETGTMSLILKWLQTPMIMQLEDLCSIMTSLRITLDYESFRKHLRRYRHTPWVTQPSRYDTCICNTEEGDEEGGGHNEEGEQLSVFVEAFEFINQTGNDRLHPTHLKRYRRRE